MWAIMQMLKISAISGLAQ
uniref:Uncharacterized protein n=1 Tax=Rhizophora mucronata TaxID=61149 RepID=A0A2P2NVR2_RHIMU